MIPVVYNVLYNVYNVLYIVLYELYSDLAGVWMYNTCILAELSMYSTA